jgi:gas vesicle protein
MPKLKFLKGALLGVVAGILMAPKSGKETREEIKRYYEEISDRISEELARMKEVTRDTYDQVVSSVVLSYQEARKITAREAELIKQTLADGFEKIRRTHEEESAKPRAQA